MPPSPTTSRLLPAALALAAGCGAAPPTAPPAHTPAAGFTDVRAASGVAVGAVAWPARIGPVNAAALADCDRDGLPDAFVFNWVGTGTLWRNRGGFRFEALPALPGLGGLAPSAAAFGDLDNDGLPDLVVALGIEEYLRFQADHTTPAREELRVYRNLGGCRFEDVSAAWGFAPWTSETGALLAGVDLADVDLDGRLDLLGRQMFARTAPVRLYLSRPDGTWAEAAADVLGVFPGSNWANLFTDVDDDGRADLFMLFDERVDASARFLHRLGATTGPRYAETVFDPRLFGPASGTASLMGGAAADVDGDGRLDVYLTDIGAQHLYTYRSGRRDVAAAAGVDLPALPDGGPTVAYSVSFADYDNDTRPDLAVACDVTDGFFAAPVTFLRHNRGDGTFEDATPLLHQGSTSRSMWMTASDLDRDGRVDYWIGGSAAPPRLLRNDVAGGRSVAVRLRGRTSNAEGVGARVTARVGARTLVQEMQSGGSPWGYGEHRLVFGVGSAAGADALEVRWPDGYVQRTGAVAAGTEAVVEEPDLVRVVPAVVPVGGTVQVVVRPAGVTGAPLGPGHRVGVALDPGGVALVVADDGAGGYTATTAALPAGLHGFTVTIDGAALLAHPQALAR